MSLTQMYQNPKINENYHPFTHASIFIGKLHRTEGDKTYAIAEYPVQFPENAKYRPYLTLTLTGPSTTYHPDSCSMIV